MGIFNRLNLNYHVVYLFIVLPIFVALKQIFRRESSVHVRVVSTILVLSVIMSQIPTKINVFFSAFVLFLFGLLTLTNGSSNNTQDNSVFDRNRSIFSILFMVTVLYMENFF